jgi:hypothetical protein
MLWNILYTIVATTSIEDVGTAFGHAVVVILSLIGAEFARSRRLISGGHRVLDFIWISICYENARNGRKFVIISRKKSVDPDADAVRPVNSVVVVRGTTTAFTANRCKPRFVIGI